MEREILVHELKTWPSYFEALLEGVKPFEIRRDDRDFRVGDILFLREWDPGTGAYTGRALHRQITYATERGCHWLRAGFVVLGLRIPSDPPREFRSPSAKPRYRLTDRDWDDIAHALGMLINQQLAKAINDIVFLAEESLRKEIVSDLRSLGSSHPELAAWAETLACRYARGEESK